MKVYKERIELVITLNNKTKRYILGTYNTLDNNYNICLDEGYKMCEGILSAVKNCNDEVNHIDNVEEKMEENFITRLLRLIGLFIVGSITLMIKLIEITLVISFKVCWIFIKITFMLTIGVFYNLLKGTK